MTTLHFKHALVVGGSGMLAGCCRSLLAVSDRVSVMARREARIRAVAPAIVPIVCDYDDSKAALRALKGQAPDLIVAWIHRLMPELRRGIAELACSGGRFVEVVGSGHGDPSRPDRLEEKERLIVGLPLVHQSVVLGFVVEAGRSRWLTDAEISDGAFHAIETGAPLTIVGTVEPWSAHP